MTQRQRSKYDELHDRYFAVLNSKGGTRYERLAALVFKSLHEDSVVIHDFKLTGSSTVKHQIDVLIEQQGRTKRVLVECKDFDVSGNPVGLDIVRDFRSVVEDTKADEAFIVTCTGFTEPAETYAKAKNIKLAVLRAFEDKDWEGRIRQVNVTFHVQTPLEIQAVNLHQNPVENAALHAACAAEGVDLGRFGQNAPLYLLGNAERVQILDFVDREIKLMSLPNEGEQVTLSVDPAIWSLQVGQQASVTFSRLEFKVRPPRVLTEKIEVVSDKIAELILKGFGNHDIVVFDEQLKRMTIDKGGEVG